MRNRVLLAVGTAAVFLPALLFAQQRPMAAAAGPHLEGTWELSAGVGGLVIGKAPTGKSAAFAPGGVLRVGYNLNQMWNLSVGAYGGYGTSWTPGTGNTAYLSPFAAATWTPDLNQVTSPFVTAGVGLFWRKTASQTDAAGHVGVGVRHILKDNLAVRGEIGLEVFNFKPNPAVGSQTSGAGFVSVGLSYFLGKKVVTTVQVTPAVATLTSLHQTQQLAAAAMDQHGGPMSGQVFGWRSSNPAVATVSQTGTVTAVGEGSATISATAAAVSGNATVTVAQAAATVAVSPATASLTSLGATQQMEASARDANDNAFPGATFSWTSSDPSVASVAASGLVTAVGNGTAQITATSGGHNAVATVTVAQATSAVAVTPATASFTAAGATAQLTAQATDGSGNAIAGKTFTWSSDAPSVATVSETGLVTAVANGMAHITATADDKSGSAAVTVTPVALPAANEVTVMTHVTFLSGRATLTRAAQTELNKFAVAIRTNPDAKWEISGYTDNVGRRATNVRLSRLRAQAVKNYLVRRGVAAASMSVVGYGPDHPIANNRTASGRAQNRRIEIKRLQ
jgi:outer membrane protein OmpA-like peptidoglycan-associated protein